MCCSPPSRTRCTGAISYGRALVETDAHAIGRARRSTNEAKLVAHKVCSRLGAGSPGMRRARQESEGAMSIRDRLMSARTPQARPSGWLSGRQPAPRGLTLQAAVTAPRNPLGGAEEQRACSQTERTLPLLAPRWPPPGRAHIAGRRKRGRPSVAAAPVRPNRSGAQAVPMHRSSRQPRGQGAAGVDLLDGTKIERPRGPHLDPHSVAEGHERRHRLALLQRLHRELLGEARGPLAVSCWQCAETTMCRPKAAASSPRARPAARNRTACLASSGRRT